MANPRTPRIGLPPRTRIPARPPAPAPARPPAPAPARPPAPAPARPPAPAPARPPAPASAAPTPRAPSPPAVTPARTARVEPGTILDPETAIPLAAPPGLPQSQEAAWCVRAIAAHARLRAKSFYDTGTLLVRLMELKAVFGAANIKELRAKAGLEMSHMTANKYLQIARAFPRELALRIGIEKCYALIVYAKAVGRRPEDAAAILRADERIQGARGLTAASASASAIYAAIRALKDARRKNTDAAVLTAERQAMADKAEKLVRLLGFKGASATVIRKGGEARIAIYVPLDTAEDLDALIPKALGRAVPRIARSSADAAAVLRGAGWSARAIGAG